MKDIIILSKKNNSNHGILREIISYDSNLISNEYVSISNSTPNQDDRKIEYLFDDNLSNFFSSYESPGFFSFDFRSRRLSLKGFYIYGIHNPYTTAFEILGSHDGVSWQSIQKYTKLKTFLYGKGEYFDLNEYSRFYRYIKYVNLESTLVSGGTTSSQFGMNEFDLFGILASSHLLQYMTCKKHVRMISYLRCAIYLFMC